MVETKEQLNIDDIVEISHDREQTKYCLDNIVLVGALKGYKATQETKDFEFWKNYTIILKKTDSRIDLKFSIKRENEIEGFEVDTHGEQKLKHLMEVVLGDKIKSLFSNRIFFSYSSEGTMVLLSCVLDFILNE
jgi:hypothetical protein